MNLPGGGTHRVAARLLTAATVSRIVDPVIADWQREYADAVQQRRIWRGRWIRCSGLGVLLRALAIYGCFRLAESVRDWPEDERRVVRRVVVIAGSATLVATMFFVVGPYLRLYRSGVNVILLMYLLPQAVPIATPLGLMFGILYGWRTRQRSRRLRNVVAIVAGATCILSFVTLDRLVPVANQAFRVEAFRVLTARSGVRTTAGSAMASPARGIAELTLSELRARAIELGNQEPASRDRRWAVAYHGRIALAFAALPLAMLALAAVRRQFGALGLTAIGIGSGTLYLVLTSVADTWVRGSDVVWLVVWLPHAGVLLVAAALPRTGPAVTPAARA